MCYYFNRIGIILSCVQQVTLYEFDDKDIMLTTKSIEKINTDSIPVDPFWNIGDEKELKIHRIHAYPAKFPAFITTKALEYVKQERFIPKRIGDIFCGCGTTACEARRNSIDFWGCDINPVATLIADVKSHSFKKGWLEKHYKRILELYSSLTDFLTYENANSRLQYWYLPKQYNDLSKLKKAIMIAIPDKKSEYQKFFLCAFSNILKPASKWLTKSIKPQIDPKKKPQDVLELFKKQYDFMIKAYEESNSSGNSDIRIETANFLDETNSPKLDMIITSPPYVTSYEYADLHQLSTLWLNYASDYREFRNGTIGSDYCHEDIEKEIAKLNSSGAEIVSKMQKIDKAKAKSIAKYYLDMQAVAKKSYNLLNDKGYALFVIGNTEYKKIHIDNALHLSESLLDAGFSELQITKRKISNKILTPYRDANGKFSSDSSGRKIYGEEFIILGKKDIE